VATLPNVDANTAAPFRGGVAVAPRGRAADERAARGGANAREASYDYDLSRRRTHEADLALFTAKTMTTNLATGAMLNVIKLAMAATEVDQIWSTSAGQPASGDRRRITDLGCDGGLRSETLCSEMDHPT